MSEVIPKSTLEEALDSISNIRYKSIGVPMIHLDFFPNTKKWSVHIRNPVRDIKQGERFDTALEALQHFLTKVEKIKEEEYE